MTQCLAPKPSACKPYQIDWRGWEEERRRYGSYKEPLNQLKRSRRLITHGGNTQTPEQWCRELNLLISPGTLWRRIAILGWSFEKAISTPRKCTFYTYQGKSQSLLAWSRELGISDRTLYYRIHKMKLPVEKAFTPSKNYRCRHFVTHMGETRTFSEWSQILGISRSTLYNRIHTSGWDVEKAFTTPLRSGKPKKKS